MLYVEGRKPPAGAEQYRHDQLAGVGNSQQPLSGMGTCARRGGIAPTQRDGSPRGRRPLFEGWFCVRVDGRGRPVLRSVRTDWPGLAMALRHEWETLVYGGLPASRAPWWRGSTVATIAPEV